MLCPIHGDIRLLHQSFHVGRVLGEVGNAERSAQVILPAAGLDRLLDGLDDFLRHADRVPRVGDILQENDELVAAEAGHGIDFAHQAMQAAGDGNEHGVARRVAVGVVDVLEVVQVEQQQRNKVAAAPGERERPLHPVGEQATVGQAGQRVVMGKVTELLGGMDAFGDVGADAVIAGKVAVFMEGRVAADENQRSSPDGGRIL